MDVRLSISIAEGEAQSHTLSDGNRTLPIILVCWHGVIGAFLNNCPHAGVRLDWHAATFFDRDHENLQGALHGALFEPGSGRCVAGPCRGSRLVRLPYQVEADGQLRFADVEKIPNRAFQTRF
jgi:nitrite reductase/ring-hydroxylating ferredoxin subunit